MVVVFALVMLVVVSRDVCGNVLIVLVDCLKHGKHKHCLVFVVVRS
jgi:hypothetical protein